MSDSIRVENFTFYCSNDGCDANRIDNDKKTTNSNIGNLYNDNGAKNMKEMLLNLPKHRGDIDLISSIINGNKEGWEYFIESYQDFIYYSIKKIIGRSKLTELLKQKALNLADDLFLGFYEHLLKNDLKVLKRYKGNSKLSSYLYACLRNFVYDFFKSKDWKVYLKEVNSSEFTLSFGDSDNSDNLSVLIEKLSFNSNQNFTPESEFFKKEATFILNDLVSQLNNDEQLYFNWLFIDDLKPSEVALISGIPSNEVSQIKYKIKAKLKSLSKGKVEKFLSNI